MTFLSDIVLKILADSPCPLDLNQIRLRLPESIAVNKITGKKVRMAETMERLRRSKKVNYHQLGGGYILYYS